VKTISIRRESSIVHLRLERPAKLNAQTHEMWHELRQLGAELGQDTSIRALIVSGAGSSFSAGLDQSVLADFAGAEVPEDLHGLEVAQLVTVVQRSFTWLADAPYPTIAAVNGHALGAGFQPALACDLRIAATDATFGLLETEFGIMPDLGGTVWLPRIVGSARAKRMMWLAERIDAQSALAHGIVDTVVPVDQLGATASELADRLATRAPLAVTAIKQSVHTTFDDPGSAFQVAARTQSRCLTSNDLLETVAARNESRDPVYTGA
jgi:enoyl-CoA hydratase/carnithine racemase